MFQKRITEKQYKSELSRLEYLNKSKERKLKLKQEKNKYKNHIKLPSTSKLVLFGMILLCLEIVVFSEIFIYQNQDSNGLYALIGIPVALVPVIWGYYSKSKAENTKDGIVYDIAMKQFDNDNSDVVEEDIEDTNSENEAEG